MHHRYPITDDGSIGNLEIAFCMATTTLLAHAAVLFLLGHPHVFVDYRLDFVFNQDGLAGMRVEWVFDDMYSAVLLEDNDVDHNGIIDKSESEGMEQNAFSNLKNYNYFTYVTAQGKCHKVKEVRDFSAAVKDGRVVYGFFMPFEVAAGSTYQDVDVCMYDVTYYVDLYPAGESPVSYTNADAFEHKHRMFEDEKESEGYGEIYPYTIRLTFARKQ